MAPLFSGAPAFAILAFLEVRTVRAMYQKAGGDNADWLQIKRHMRAVRALGYATSIDDPDLGIIHISAPLKQDDGGIAGSLTLALPSGPDNATMIAKASVWLIEGAADMAQQILLTTRR
ncbi:hypothetical protein [Nitrospirillum viridazoti]|uniref:hypothetical protein n=1 Tax=Nitrospirillum viridazoti TaxID=3144925 RepID=UPI001FCB260C|nr:hypothetical protein [Nitrospirillum amazonense]